MSIELGRGPGRCAASVVELAGIGPGPHACMILADLGADVIRVDRPGGQPLTGGPHDFLNRGRPSVALDLKHPDGVATVLRLVETADVLVEGLRPGVTERLGLGPDACHERNPRLVYGRVTGWGQDRPARASGRPRPRLRRHHRRAVRPGPGPGPPALPDQPGRRLRRRLDVPGHRRPCGAAGGPRLRSRPGGRRGHRRRHRPPQRDDREPPRQRDGDRAARGQPARRRRAVLRPLRDRRRPPSLRRPARAAVLRRLRRPARHRATAHPTATTRPSTRPCGRSSPRPCAPGRWRSGPRSSTAATPAWRRCCPSARRCTTRTSSIARCTSTGPALPNRRRRRASPAPGPLLRATTYRGRHRHPRALAAWGIEDVDVLIASGAAVQA